MGFNENDMTRGVERRDGVYGTIGAEETQLKAQIRDACVNAAKASRLTDEGRDLIRKRVSELWKELSDCGKQQEVLVEQLALNVDKRLKLRAELRSLEQDLIV